MLSAFPVCRDLNHQGSTYPKPAEGYKERGVLVVAGGEGLAGYEHETLKKALVETANDGYVTGELIAHRPG